MGYCFLKKERKEERGEEKRGAPEKIQ